MLASLPSLVRCSSPLQLERALSALCASTSGCNALGADSSPLSKDFSHLAELHSHSDPQVCQESLSSTLIGSLRSIARVGNHPGVAYSIGKANNRSLRTFATADSSFFGETFSRPNDGESLQKSMAAIKANMSVGNLKDLGRESVNKFYTLTEEDRKLLMTEGFPKSLEKEFAEQKDHRILVRQQSLDLLERVKQLVEDRDDDQYRALVLDGPRGSGKSALLALLVLQCRAAGWLVLYVPSGKSWISGWFYERDEASALYDTSVQAEEALKALLAAHGDLLESCPIRVSVSALGPLYGGTASVDFDERAANHAAPEEGSLKDLVEAGLAEEGAEAGKYLARLRVELSLMTDVPVLIAIDEYNTWFGDSDYSEVIEDALKSRKIEAGRLRLVRAFGQLDGPLGLRNGVVVAASTESLPLPSDVRRSFEEYSRRPPVRKTVTVLDGESSSEKIVTVPGTCKRVERLNKDETGALLTNYFVCGVMPNASKRPTAQTIQVANSVTGGNGEDLRFYGPLLQADREAQPSPEAIQPLVEGGGYNRGGERRPAPRISNFVESLSGGT